MSHLEFAAILRAKAWRNCPGVFAAPEIRKEPSRAGQAGGPIDFVGLSGVAIWPAAIACPIIRHVPETYETNETRTASR